MSSKQQSQLQRTAKSGEPTMQAAAFDAYNTEPKLTTVAALPDPAHTVGHEQNILVKVAASSINPIDWKLASGAMKFMLYSQWPKYFGRDFSGEVISVGSAVTHHKPGDKVFGMVENVGGAHAQYIICHQNSAAQKPSNLTHKEAASLPLAAMTAYESIFTLGQLKEGQNLLVLGGSSGVGNMAVQLGKSAGANVFATCGPDNVDFVKKAGADKVINYRSDKLDEVLKDDIVHLVFDAVGSRPDRDRAFTRLTRGGVIVTTNPIDETIQGSEMWKMARSGVGLIWSNLYNFYNNRSYVRPMFASDFQRNNLTVLKNLVEEGKVKPEIDSVFPLSDVAAAFKKSQGGRVRGKIVVDIDTERSGDK